VIRSRNVEGSAAYLKGIGLRNASLIFDNAGHQSVWRIREAEFGFDHGPNASHIGGDLSLATESGNWQLTFSARQKMASDAVTVEAKVSSFVPKSIANTVPELAVLAAFDMPINGTAALELSRSGQLVDASAEFAVGRGMLAPTWQGAGKAEIESGRVRLRYSKVKEHIVIEPSRFVAPRGWATIGGTVAIPRRRGDPWRFLVAASEGMAASPEFGIAPRPIKALRVHGSYSAEGLHVAEANFDVGDGRIGLSGTIPAPGAPAGMNLVGSLSPMHVDTLKLLWPSVVAPEARSWCGLNIKDGKIVAGNFRVEGGALPAGATASPPAPRFRTPIRTTLTIEGAGIALEPKRGFSTVEVPRALIRVDGHTLEIAAPEAAILSPSQKRLPLKGVRMLSSNLSAPASTADLTFRTQGSLATLLELAEKEAKRTGRQLSLPGDRLDGRIDAQMRIEVPLGSALTSDDFRIEGKGRVTDGKARAVLGKLDATGAALSFEVTEKAIKADGVALVGGVNMKIAVSRVFSASAADQQPAVISATLDSSDRKQLGIDVNDLIVGDVPVTLTVTPRENAEPHVQVGADLTKAEIVLEPLAWRKPPGRPAKLTFDVVKTDKQQLELQNFRLVGDEIAISGMLSLDARQRLKEFSFPEFSLHVVSRLSIGGKLRNDNVWDVKVNGSTFAGNDFFQSLFSVGQVRPEQAPAKPDRSGLDLRAEVDNVLGFNGLALKGLRLQMSRRGGNIVALSALGTVTGEGASGRPLEVGLNQSSGSSRRLVALSDDAGSVFRLINFYPHMQGGRMRLEVNLDGRGPAEKTGILLVERFDILGDPTISSAQTSGSQRARRRSQREMQASRPVLPFDSMRAPFSIGHGQFVLHDADLRGPVLGVVLKGTADYRARRVDLGGTYVPLQGLNSVVGAFPILGQILAGPRGEGVIGMTFAIQGPMDNPQMVVNPLSGFLPGILREMMQMTNPTPEVTPRAGSRPSRGGTATRSRVDGEGGWSSK
jgi:hypothetical protein